MISVEEAHKELEQRMLSGWTMLSETCPISGYPLVRKDGVTFSIRCGMEVKFENASQQELSPVPKDEAGSTDGSNRKESKRGAHADVDAYSREIGSMLLQGWAMMEEECPVSRACPLMKNRKNGKIYSVAAKRYFTEEELERGVIFEEPLPPAAPLPPTAPLADVEPEKAHGVPKFVDEDAQSRDLSSKLLSGWVMVEDVCPVSKQCPLMKSPKDGRLWSAALGRYITDAELGVGDDEEREVRAKAESTSTQNECMPPASPVSQDSKLSGHFEFAASKVKSVLRESAIALTISQNDTDRCTALVALIGECADTLRKLKAASQ